MNRTDKEFDEYGKRILTPLRQTPSMDPDKAAVIRTQYLHQAASMSQGFALQPNKAENGEHTRNIKYFPLFRRLPVMKTVAAIIIAILIVLAGSSISVYAAQRSLPGDPLYSIKTLGEDFRLSMTFSTKAKLDLTLNYTNRRVNEISTLITNGKSLTDRTSDRYQRELDNALQYAAQLDDNQIGYALGHIKTHAENQGMTMEELITMLPEQAEAAVARLQARLAEQVKLSQDGEVDPHAFRAQILERLKKQHGNNKNSNTGQPDATSPDLTSTQDAKDNGNGHGNETHQPAGTPGKDSPGNGNGQSTPGKGDKESNEKQTQEP